jgi:hypothetical protein
MRTWFRAVCLIFGLCIAAESTSARADLLSYPTSATDIFGVTGASAVSLGVPDYQFINDFGLGFGGTSMDVFDVGEAVELRFPVPLRNIPTQHDLILSAFVGGGGATDNASLVMEVSSDGINFVAVAAFDTEEARDRVRDLPENNFEGVKHFFVDFGTEDHVTVVRLTNVAGTAEGFRLDAVEGLHPEVGSDHAFEIRFDRTRPDFVGQFFVRIKNISDVGGVPIREFRMTRSPAPGATLEDTEQKLYTDTVRGIGVVGESFICVENCIQNGGSLIPFSRHAWSVDGIVEAPPGVGLDPGRQAFNDRLKSFDTDSTDYLTGMTFRVTFADGLVHDFSYDHDVTQVLGSLYQKYLYFDDPPAESWNRPTDYYQFVQADPAPVPTLSVPAYWILALLILTISGVLARANSRGV